MILSDLYTDVSYVTDFDNKFLPLYCKYAHNIILPIINPNPNFTFLYKKNNEMINTNEIPGIILDKLIL